MCVYNRLPPIIVSYKPTITIVKLEMMLLASFALLSIIFAVIISQLIKHFGQWHHGNA